MANYRIPKEISSELKINKALYLFDLLFIIGLLVSTMVFNNFVHDSLKIVYYIFMGIVGVIAIWRPVTNPQKRMYEVLYITIMHKKNTYSAIDTEPDQN